MWMRVVGPVRPKKKEPCHGTRPTACRSWRTSLLVDPPLTRRVQLSTPPLHSRPCSRPRPALELRPAAPPTPLLTRACPRWLMRWLELVLETADPRGAHEHASAPAPRALLGDASGPAAAGRGPAPIEAVVALPGSHKLSNGARAAAPAPWPPLSLAPAAPAPRSDAIAASVHRASTAHAKAYLTSRLERSTLSRPGWRSSGTALSKVIPGTSSCI